MKAPPRQNDHSSLSDKDLSTAASPSSVSSSSDSSSLLKASMNLKQQVLDAFWKDPDEFIGIFLVTICVVLCYAVNQQEEGSQKTAFSDAFWFAASCFGPKALIPWLQKGYVWTSVAILILWTIFVPVNIGDAIWRFVAGSATSLSILTVMDFGQWRDDSRVRGKTLQELPAGQVYNNLLMLIDCTQGQRYEHYHQLWTWNDTKEVALAIGLKIPVAIWALHQVQAQYLRQEEQLMGVTVDNNLALLPPLPMLPWIATRCFLAGFVACESLALLPKQYGLLGYYGLKIKHPPVMRDPYSATSLSDFWGRRWDIVIQERLKRAIYQPLRRKWKVPKNLCAFLVFCVSGLLHVFILASGGLVHEDWASLLSCMAFFCIQAPLMSLELTLFGKEEHHEDHEQRQYSDKKKNDGDMDKKNKAPPSPYIKVLRRIYLFTCIFVTTPLLLEPILRANPRLR